MVIINTIDDKYFTLNGIEFAKIYQPLAQGTDAIGIFSVFDTRQSLMNSTKFDEFSIDSVVYGTQAEAMAAMLIVIYSIISASDVSLLEGRVDNLEENQYSGVVVYSTLAELPVTGTLLVSYKVSNDPTDSNNGYYHWTGSAYLKDATLDPDTDIAIAENEKGIRKLFRTYDQDWSFRGYANTSDPTPSTPSTNDIYLATETGTIFGVAGVPEGGILIYNGAAFVLTDVERDLQSMNNFTGVANPSTVPVLGSNGASYYLAYERGVYANFNSYEHSGNHLVAFFYDGSAWTTKYISHKVFLAGEINNDFRNAIIDLRIQGGDKDEIYFVRVLARAASDGYYKFRISRWDDPGFTDVCALKALDYKEPKADGSGRVYDYIFVDEFDSSGIKANVVIDWGQIALTTSINIDVNYAQGLISNNTLIHQIPDVRIDRIEGRGNYNLKAAGADIWNLDFQLLNIYRNRTIKATWPTYKRIFTEEPLNADDPRYDYINIGAGILPDLVRNASGLSYVNNDVTLTEYHVKTFVKVKSPNIMVSALINEYDAATVVKVGICKQSDVYAYLRKSSTVTDFVLETIGGGQVVTPFTNIDTKSQPFRMIFFLGNDHFRIMIETVDGLQDVGTVSSTAFIISDPAKSILFSPAFGFQLPAGEKMTIGEFETGYFEGIGQGGIRSVTYENGEPYRNANGNYYITAASKFMRINGGNAGITVYEIDSYGQIIKPVSIIVAKAKSNGFLEAGTAAKLVYDRYEKRWIYTARAFPTPGGKVHIGITKEDLTSNGLHLVTCYTDATIEDNSVDSDLVKIGGLWYLAYHGDTPREFILSSSEDLETWTEITRLSTGEGLSILRKDNQYYILDATDRYNMNIRELFNPAVVVGTLTLTPTPGNPGLGGFPWGCLLPINTEDFTRYVFVCFTNDQYIEQVAGDFFSYGDIFSYVSEEETGSEF